MPDTNEPINYKRIHDVEEFLYNLTEGQGEAAVIIMSAAEMFYSNPRLVEVIVEFQGHIRNEHAAQNGHENCTHEEYRKGMWEGINKALPFNSEVRDYIDFPVE